MFSVHQYLNCRGDAPPHRELVDPDRDLGVPHQDLSAGWSDEKEPASMNKFYKFWLNIVPFQIAGENWFWGKNTSIFGKDLKTFFLSSPNFGEKTLQFSAKTFFFGSGYPQEAK